MWKCEPSCSRYTQWYQHSTKHTHTRSALKELQISSMLINFLFMTHSTMYSVWELWRQRRSDDDITVSISLLYVFVAFRCLVPPGRWPNRMQFQPPESRNLVFIVRKTSERTVWVLVQPISHDVFLSPSFDLIPLLAPRCVASWSKWR